MSIVIPCHNSAHDLPRLLSSLTVQEVDLAHEIIVVDNRSTDATAEIAAGFEGRLPLQIVKADKWAGPAYAMNAGVEASQADAFVFVGSDDVPGPGFITAMAEALREHDVVAPQLDVELLNDSRVFTWRADRMQDGELSTTYGFLPWASGTGLGITRRAFVAVGGFDASLPAAEDVDVSWRMQLHGIPIHVEPRAILHYKFRSTLSGLYLQGRGYGIGQAALYRKFAKHGMPRHGPTAALRDWLWLLSQIPRVPTRENWSFWLHMFGYRVGRLRGSLRYRVFYL